MTAKQKPMGEAAGKHFIGRGTGKWFFAIFFAVVLGGAATPTKRAYAFDNLKTIPVSEIRRGMVGYGLTVLQGKRPERFRVRVIGVLHNAFPRQDLILILCDDPKLKETGVAGGMSGTPIYFNGRLAGALGYGPVWAKSPVAMVTPIKDMIDTAKLPLRGPENTILASRYRLERRDMEGIARLGLTYPKLNRLPMPDRGWNSSDPGAIRPLALPVTVSGVDKEGLAFFRKEMEPYGMFPIRGGGGDGVDAVKRYGRQRKFEPGGSIGVQFVRGDVTATATGTVTAVSGDKVLAFGHPFWGFGEHYVPVTGAWIHMVMPVLQSSYKIATPLEVIGSLVQDRRPAIVASSAKRAPMIPLELRINTGNRKPDVFNVEVFSNRITTPRYLFAVTQMILQSAASDVSDVAVRARVTMELDGMADLTFTDYFAEETGVAHGFSPAATRGFRLLNFLLRNPFRRVSVSRVKVELDARFTLERAVIHSLSLSRSEAAPNSTVELTVRMKKWLGDFYEHTIPVKIPDVPDDSLVRIHVQPGNTVTPDHAPPESLMDVVDFMNQTMSARQLVVSIRTAGEGSSAHGRLLTDLPGSIVDSIRTSSDSVTRRQFTRVWRRSVWDAHVLSGESNIVLRVNRDASQD